MMCYRQFHHYHATPTYILSNKPDRQLFVFRRVLFIKRGDLLMQWDVEWTYDWVALQEPPSLVEKTKLKFMAKVLYNVSLL